MKRFQFIDNLRVALTALVIIHHTAIGYGASGGWCYVTPDTIKGWGQILLSALLSVDQAFFMSLFFFISAYFTPDSYDKKGFKEYLRNRFVRLGIPLIIYSTLINPVLNYFILVHTNRADRSLAEYMVNSNLTNPNTGHMWFVLALLIFEVAYALFREYTALSARDFISIPAPAHKHLVSFVFITGIIAFLLRTVYPIGGKNIIGLQLGYFTLYIAMYGLGIVANRNKWLDNASYRVAKIWFGVSLSVIPLILWAWVQVTRAPGQIGQFIGGFHWKSLFLAAWEAVVCVGFSYFLILFFQKSLNKSNQFLANMAADSYATYIIHPLIVVGVTILLEPLALAPASKFVLAGAFIVTACFATAHVIRKVPGIKKVL